MTHDGNGQADLYAADGVLEWPFAPEGVPRRVEGREEIRKLLVRLHEGTRRAPATVGEGDASVVWHETADPEVGIAEIDARMTTADGTVQRTLVQIYRVRDGEIVSLRDFWDGDEVKNWLDQP
jgi:ketosteroid isomerase-like protein